jgi:hypothetical protein
MKRTLLTAAMAIATSMVLSTPAAYADTITLTATLSGAIEVPPTGSAGTGFATVVLNTTANTMFVDRVAHPLLRRISFSKCQRRRRHAGSYIFEFTFGSDLRELHSAP